MGIINRNTDYSQQENLVEIDDLFEVSRRTTAYRVEKVKELRREQELLVRKIRKLKKQKRSYLRQISVLSADEDPENTMPVDYLNDVELPESELLANVVISRNDLGKNPTDGPMNYVRDYYRQNIGEAERVIRDYDYRLMKYSLREQRLREDISMMLQRESSLRETNNA